MIGVANPLPPLCSSCGVRVDYELEDLTGTACNDCFFESERAATEEAIRDFRWLSRDWFKCHSCGGTGVGFERWCHCAAGDAAHAAEAARFGFVSKKAPAPVLELPEMIEYLDVCLWARPVLTRGLTLRVQSWEGRTIAGDILFPGRAVPLSPAEIDAFTRRAA